MASIADVHAPTPVSASKNPTHVILILDCSGSMDRTRSKMISGFNEFIQKQKKIVDGTVATFITFADQAKIVLNRVPIGMVTELTEDSYVCDGMTALYDAVGLACHEFAGMCYQTIVVTLTDGEENSSQHYTGPKVSELIQQRTSEGWRFIYLGNNIETAAAGDAIGISSATRGARNPTTQNLMADQSRYGTVLSRQVSEAVLAYRTTSEIPNMEELSSQVSELKIQSTHPTQSSTQSVQFPSTSSNYGPVKRSHSSQVRSSPYTRPPKGTPKVVFSSVPPQIWRSVSALEPLSTNDTSDKGDTNDSDNMSDDKC